VSHVVAIVAGSVPVLTFVVSGIALLPTRARVAGWCAVACGLGVLLAIACRTPTRSEEHTSELQSRI